MNCLRWPCVHTSTEHSHSHTRTKKWNSAVQVLNEERQNEVKPISISVRLWPNALHIMATALGYMVWTRWSWPFDQIAHLCRFVLQSIGIWSRIRLNGTRKRKFIEEYCECMAATMNLRFRFEPSIVCASVYIDENLYDYNISLDMYNYRYLWHRICLLLLHSLPSSRMCFEVTITFMRNVFPSIDFNVDFMRNLDSKICKSFIDAFIGAAYFDIFTFENKSIRMHLWFPTTTCPIKTESVFASESKPHTIANSRLVFNTSGMHSVARLLYWNL